VQISGDSGSGKSNALEVVLHRLARIRDAGLLFIDPHGDSAKKLLRMALAAGPSVARRVVYIHPAGIERLTQKLPTINPLHVPGLAGSLRWSARLTVVVDVVAKILLAAFGENDFNSKPVLFKNTYRILSTLAYAGLSLADARLLLDLNSPIYRPLVRACPDLLMREQMDELPDLRAADRQAQIESTANRFFGLLSNPIFAAMVSRTEGALNFAELYAERAIVIVDLELGGVFRPLDQQILANLFLTGMTFEILNAPAERRYPFFVALDELPVFSASFELLAWLATQTRKFLCRLVVAHQGVGGFPERADDPLLQALASQMRTKLIFRHGSVADCDYFGGILALADYNPLKTKHVLHTPQQFQVGHRLVVLEDESDGTSQSAGSSDASGTTDTLTSTVTNATNSADARTLKDLVEQSRTNTSGQSSSDGRSNATGTQKTFTNNQSTGSSHSVTRKQQLVPVIETRQVVSSVQFLTREEQAALKGTALARLPTGAAFLYVTGKPALPVLFPLAVDPFARTPIFARKKEVEHRVLQERSPAFATFADITRERESLVAALVEKLYALLDNNVLGPPAPLLALSTATPLATVGEFPARPMPANVPADSF
jgi:hypothetical protein